MDEVKKALVDYLKWFEIIPHGPTMDNETGLLKVNHGIQKKMIKLAQRYIVRLARLLAHLRGVAPTWNSNDSQGSNYALYSTYDRRAR